jgi:hypothetical protein
MATSKAINKAVIDLMLQNIIDTTTTILYCNMISQPIDGNGVLQASMITNVLASRTVTPASFQLTSGSSIKVLAGTQILCNISGIANTIILKTMGGATDGVIKLIDTGNTSLSAGTYYTPAEFTISVATVN